MDTLFIIGCSQLSSASRKFLSCLFGAYEEVSGANIQAKCQFDDDIQCGVSHATFDTADIGAVEADVMREILL